MSGAHYSTARARRGLLHFVIGKGLSALVGLIVLLLTIRVLTPQEFGEFVAVIAFLEIFYLATGFGLSTIAQRYVAEFRVKAGRQQFAQFLRSLVIRRFAFAMAGAVVIGVAAGLLKNTGENMPFAALSANFYALLVLGCMTRYADEIFSALLLQGHTQGLVLMGHVVRLVALAVMLTFDQLIDLDSLLKIELFVGLICGGTSHILLQRYLTEKPELAETAAEHINDSMTTVARQFYLVQLLGQLWSPNTGKLVVAHHLGLAVTASYGFLQSITDMLRNYLPAYLLVGWVRPLMISRYLACGNLKDVNAMASLIFKLSLLCIAPLAVFFSVMGDTFIAWASGGKVLTGSAILLAFCLLLCLQCLHIVVGLITITVERGSASAMASALACVSLPLTIAGAILLGPLGVVAGLAFGECIWLATVLHLLAREGLNIKIDAKGCLLILSPTLPTYLVLDLLSSIVMTLSPLWATLLGASVALALVIFFAALLKPFTSLERTFIARIYPARFFIW